MSKVKVKIKDNKSEVKERMTLLLQVMQQTMLTTNIAIGFDLKNTKLVLKDVESGLISRVDLEELNKIFAGGNNEGN